MTPVSRSSLRAAYTERSSDDQASSCTIAGCGSACGTGRPRPANSGADLAAGQFLALPLVARVAAIGPRGPTVRPVWFLYEEGALWWLTAASYSRLGEWLAVDPRVAVTIDSCDLVTGEVLAVSVTGRANVVAFDAERAERKLAKYLGPDRDHWAARFTGAFEDPTSRLVVLRPNVRPRLRDLSFSVPA